jgi:hypothetical protein
MRRKERIDEILAIIRKKWVENSDQRLGQLLENYFGYPRGDIFFVEDSVFGIKLFDDEENEWKKLAEQMGRASKKLEKAMKTSKPERKIKGKKGRRIK